MNRFKVFLPALIIFTVYFLIGTKGAFFSPLTAFFPLFHYYFTISLFIFVPLYLYTSKKNYSYPEKLKFLPFLIFPATMFLWAFYYGYHYMKFVPAPDDGVNYLWLSKLISHGKFYLELPEFKEHYHSNFISSYREKYTSVFLPGFTIFLAPFARIGVPYLFNPAIAGINSLLVGKHALKLKDKTTAIVAMSLFLFSSVHIMHGGMYFSHHFGLFLVLSSSYIIVHKERTLKNILISGLIIAPTLFMRPQNAIYIYFAFTIYLFATDKKIKHLLFFTIPFLFFGFILMGYNMFFTGNPFYFIQDAFFDVLHHRKLCHRPGFGKGCLNIFGTTLPAEGTNLRFLMGITFLRLNNFLYRITAHPALLFFIIPAVLKKPGKYFLYYFTPLLCVFSYFFFYIEGNIGGPRYLMESGALLLIVAACGISWSIEKLSNSGFIGKIASGSIIAFVISSFIFFSTALFPNITSAPPYETAPHIQIKNIIKNNNIKNSIVLLPFVFEYHPHSILTVQDNPPHDKHRNLIIYSLNFPQAGLFLDDNLRKYYKGSKYEAVWIFHQNGYDFHAEEIGFIENDHRFVVEFEAKGIPSSGLPHYVIGIPPQFYGAKYGIPEPGNIPFRFMGLLVEFKEGKENWYGFQHSVKNSGQYNFELGFVALTCTTGFTVEINGKNVLTVTPEFDPQKVQKIQFEGELQKGRNRFRILPQKDGCVILDYLDMEIKPDN